MTDECRVALTHMGRLLAYPDEQLFLALPALAEEAAALKDYEATASYSGAAQAALDALAQKGQPRAAEEYVGIFDHTSAASLYLAWHRYGNDRAQGKALAALNGLYRTAGFEPVQGAMPDYLPKMLEFMAIAPDWAVEALLDGFGPEIMGIIATLSQMQSIYARPLEKALQPLQALYPDQFKPRTGPDPTKRPMANPEAEPPSLAADQRSIYE